MLKPVSFAPIPQRTDPRGMKAGQSTNGANNKMLSEDQIQQMVFTGLQFADLADMSISTPARYPMTFAVNSAFACELLLKAITALEGKSVKKIHNLESLFKSLSVDTRQALQQRWNNYFDVELAKRLKAQTGIDTPLTLTAALKEGADAFQQWRYAFENPPPNFHLPCLTAACSAHIGAQRPDWPYPDFREAWHPLKIDAYRRTTKARPAS